LTPIIRFWIGLSAVMFAACLWQASPARAQQGFPCTGAAGERVVGATEGGHGVASIPLCMWQTPPAPIPNSYAAIAWHPDASDIWIDGNYLGPGTAEGVALAACNRAMGGGCSGSGEWSNSSMAVIRDRNGAFFAAWMGNGGAERRRVLDERSAKQPLPCEVFMTVDSHRDRHWPGPEARVAYAAAAWLDPSDSSDRKLYVASGYRTADEASALAVSACEAAGRSRKCKVVALTGGGFIQTATFEGGRDFATVETSAPRARQSAERLCRQNGGQHCEIQAVFNSRVRGQFVHDFSGAAEG
jgi:hypothetical protein